MKITIGMLLMIVAVLGACSLDEDVTTTISQDVCTIEDQDLQYCTMQLLLDTRQYAAATAPDGVEYSWSCHPQPNGLNKCSVSIHAVDGDLLVTCGTIGICSTTPCGIGTDNPGCIP